MPPAGPTYVPPAGPTRRTDSLAVASLVCSVAAIAVCPLSAPIGVVLGVLAKRRIRESDGTLDGDGLASAGMIVGGVITLFIVAGLVFGIVVLLGLAR